MRIVFDVNVVHSSSGSTLRNTRVIIQKAAYSRLADNRLEGLLTSTARCFTCHQLPGLRTDSLDSIGH